MTAGPSSEITNNKSLNVFGTRIVRISGDAIHKYAYDQFDFVEID